MDFRATKPRAPRDAKPHLAEKAKPAGSGKAGTRKAPQKVGKSKALSQAQKAIAKPRTKAPTKGKRDADKLKTRGAKVVRDVVPKRMLKRLQTWAFDKMNGGLSDESAGAKTRAQRFAAGVPGIIADDREIGYSSRARKRFSVQPTGGLSEQALAVLRNAVSVKRSDPNPAAWVSDGSGCLEKLEQYVLTALARDLGKPGLQPFYHQVQYLPAGAEIAWHQDPYDCDGDVITTVVLQGDASYVAVGEDRFKVGRGDVYGIANYAKDEVAHMVEAPPSDRYTITLRFWNPRDKL